MQISPTNWKKLGALKKICNIINPVSLVPGADNCYEGTIENFNR
jgi:hypothetical protein